MENSSVVKDIDIRRASMEDKDAVLSIHDNVYDGRDYLPSYYENFITCRNTTCYLASLRGVVIGFCAELLVDGGHTSVIRAGRVSPRAQGTGVYKKLTEHVKRFTKAVYHTFITDDKNPAISTESFQQTYNLVLTRSMSEYVFKVEQLSEFKSAMSSMRPLLPDKHLLERYMTSSTTSQYLFPYNRMIVHWVPYMLVPSNIPLFNLHDSKFVSDVTENAGGSISGLLSISTLYACKRPPFACHIDIYGSKLASLRDHLLWHLSRIYENVKGTVDLVVFMNQDNDINELSKILEELDVSGLISSVPERQCLFEKNTVKPNK